MPRLGVLNSIVTRTVAALIVGGLLVSAGLSVLELRQAGPTLQMDMARHVALVTRNLQGALRGMLTGRTDLQLQDTLNVFTHDPSFRAVRLTMPGRPAIVVGEFPPGDDATLAHWLMPEHVISTGTEMAMDRPTLVRAPFTHEHQPVLLELLVDGQTAYRQMRSELWRELATQWLLLSVMTLLGLLLLRRWVTGPLSRVMELVSSNAGPEPFYDAARRQHGEFRRLAEAIGGMLTRLDCTTQRLKHRERALEHLYHFAPAAMLSLDTLGQIVEANNKAAELLGVGSQGDLHGRTALDFVRPEDRALLRQTIDRLDLAKSTRCELRLLTGDQVIDVVVECSAVRDDDGQVQNVRLSLQDVSNSKLLQRQLADKSQLLNLVIDHMSDAILLADEHGHIAAHNQQLATLLHRRSGSFVGEKYDPETFWDELGIVNQKLFVSRIRQIEAELERPAQERFETRVGTFQFQGIPVHDSSGRMVGRLWVVQETTGQEASQRLLNEQTHQLRALKRMGQRLSELTDLDDLVFKTCLHAYEALGVEAVGIALRREDGAGRSAQVLHRGPGPYLLEPNKKLTEAIERQLMPMILSNQDVTFWPDLPTNQPWARTFNHAGLTCLAGSPLRGSAEAEGIIWIARRGGERLERHHIYLLEALGPVLAGKLEVARLYERMRSLEMTDPVTNLPSQQQFENMLSRVASRPGRPWSVLLLNIDHFRSINHALDHSSADLLLRTVAQSLRRTCRRSTFVSRFAGATFAFLCPGHERPDVIGLADRLRAVIAAQQIAMPGGTTRSLTASVGVACANEFASVFTPGEIVDLAVHRLEMAKRLGRDRVVADGDVTQQAG